MNILLTGFTGNLGLEIARSLAQHRVLALVRGRPAACEIEGVELVAGSLEQLPEAIAHRIDLIVHSAAWTSFRAPLADLRRVNVEGTAALLDYARRCPRMRRFIHLSTTCVAGDHAGVIPEAPLPRPGRFVNGYEESKWEAEELVLSAQVPVEIARLSIVAGSKIDGAVRRPGALHHTLYWLFKGLIPMLPGRADSRVDLISTEFAASAIAALVAEKSKPGRIVHVSSGENAPRLGELLDFLATLFAEKSRGWASGAIALPEIVDAKTFALFHDSARQSGDLLFQRVCDDAEAFLPGLLHPRRIATSLASRIAAPDWRLLAERVFSWLHACNWGRGARTESFAYATA